MAEIIQLPRDQVATAARTIAEAFAGYPVTQYFFREPSLQVKGMKAIALTYLAMGRRVGLVEATERSTGVAIWFRPGRHISLTHMLVSPLALIPFQVGLGSAIRMFRYSLWIGGIHDRRNIVGSWYLHNLAVAPEEQRRGIGTELLVNGLRRSDKQGASCYLETSEVGNLTFYERNGFRVVEHKVMPGNNLAVWLMRRSVVTQTAPV